MNGRRVFYMKTLTRCERGPHEKANILNSECQRHAAAPGVASMKKDKLLNLAASVAHLGSIVFRQCP